MDQALPTALSTSNQTADFVYKYSLEGAKVAHWFFL
jgi:hypothetical protein